MGCDLGFAFALADLAASLSVAPFRAGTFSVQTKSDGSPVTNVDRAVETALREYIAHHRTSHMVIGEEAGRSGRSEWCWYLDPIDGTSRYVDGDPRWMTLIALAHREQIVLGVVDLPARGERWWASRGQGAFCDGRPIAVSTTARLREATINDDWHEHIARGDHSHPISAVAARCARVRPHDGHASLAVACGRADIAISLGSEPWDYAALKVIVEEAGGTYTDFAGTPRIDTGQAVASNGLIHGAVLDVLDDLPGAPQP